MISKKNLLATLLSVFGFWWSEKQNQVLKINLFPFLSLSGFNQTFFEYLQQDCSKFKNNNLGCRQLRALLLTKIGQNLHEDKDKLGGQKNGRKKCPARAFSSKLRSKCSIRTFLWMIFGQASVGNDFDGNVVRGPGMYPMFFYSFSLS